MCKQRSRSVRCWFPRDFRLTFTSNGVRYTALHYNAAAERAAEQNDVCPCVCVYVCDQVEGKKLQASSRQQCRQSLRAKLVRNRVQALARSMRIYWRTLCSVVSVSTVAHRSGQNHFVILPRLLCADERSTGETFLPELRVCAGNVSICNVCVCVYAQRHDTTHSVSLV